MLKQTFTTLFASSLALCSSLPCHPRRARSNHDSERRDGRLPPRPQRESSRNLQRRVLHVCGRLAVVGPVSGATFSNRPVRHLDVRPERTSASDQTLFRHRGRPGLVARHGVCHGDAEVHHGRRGAEFQRVGQRTRGRAREETGRNPKANTAWRNSAPGCCGRPMA